MRNRKFWATLSLTVLVAAATIFCSIPVQAAELSTAKNATSVKYGNVTATEEAVLKGLFDYEYYKKTNPDLAAKFGDNKEAYFLHFIKRGLYEGRSLRADFNVSAYASAYSDLRNKFQENIALYYVHYAAIGSKENRPITTLKAAANAGITVTSVADSAIVLRPEVIKVAEAKGITDAAEAEKAAKSSSGSSSSSGGGSSSSGSSSSSGGSTPKPTPTPTPTPSGEGEEPTPTPTPTPSGEGEEPTPTPTPTPSGEGEEPTPTPTPVPDTTPASVVISQGASDTVAAGEAEVTKTYSAVVKNSAGESEGVNQAVTWTVSGNALGVTINSETGELSIPAGCADGDVTVTATIAGASGDVTASITVTITGYVAPEPPAPAPVISVEGITENAITLTGTESVNKTVTITNSTEGVNATVTSGDVNKVTASIDGNILTLTGVANTETAVNVTIMYNGATSYTIAVTVTGIGEAETEP